MPLIAALAAGPTEYKGSGVNHEGENFAGTLCVQQLLGGMGVLLHYEAKVGDHEVVHQECTLLAEDMNGNPTLWPLMSELPGVLPHVAFAQSESECRFASGDRNDKSIFREEITISLGADGSVTYAHAWGLPGGEFEDRSSCRLWPSDA
jgi:hypothetical protein